MFLKLENQLRTKYCQEILTPLKTFEWSPLLPEVPCYHILDTFFLLTEGGVKKSISQSQILLAHQKTHPPYLHLAAQISFCEKGPPIPTSPSSPPCSA